ncbi:MAG: hypothetical protein WD046_04405 [Paracoccaceae bacterium]
MARLFYVILAFLTLAAPVFAQEDLQTIGQIEAAFDGETLSQTTVSYLAEGKREGTASLMTTSGYTSLSIYAAEGGPISIEVMYSTTATPDQNSRPIDVTISYFPSGLAPYWTSEDAPEPAQIVFELLDTATDEPYARGTFEAVLCRVAQLGDEADIDNCKPISGRFDTGLILD